MPELPEVETVINSLKSLNILGEKIIEVETTQAKHFKEEDFEIFRSRLKNQTIKRIERKGKWIMFFLDDWVLFSHLRMTGKYFVNNFTSVPVVTFFLSNGSQLMYFDPRGFGVFYIRCIKNWWLNNPFKSLGRDAVKEKISSSYLLQRFKKTSHPIKHVLLDQSIIAGIGNIYASEILFYSSINPLKTARDLTKKEIEMIIKNTISIMRRAIDLKGSSVVDFISPFGEGSFQKELKVYGRKNKECFVCRTKILSIYIKNRSSFFCPLCQK